MARDAFIPELYIALFRLIDVPEHVSSSKLSDLLTPSYPCTAAVNASVPNPFIITALSTSDAVGLPLVPHSVIGGGYLTPAMRKPCLSTTSGSVIFEGSLGSLPQVNSFDYM
jgi:hypothetical protein